MTVSHKACITRPAILSKGVFYMFTITKFFFLNPTLSGIFAAGVTLNELPIHKHKSATSAYLKPSSNSHSGRFSPKFIMESLRLPPHSHFLPVK